jgi:hypothetical protein
VDHPKGEGASDSLGGDGRGDPRRHVLPGGLGPILRQHAPVIPGRRIFVVLIVVVFFFFFFFVVGGVVSQARRAPQPRVHYGIPAAPACGLGLSLLRRRRLEQEHNGAVREEPPSSSGSDPRGQGARRGKGTQVVERRR